MKEYLNPKESLEGKAKDALEAEALWDAKCLEDFSSINAIQNSAFLNEFDSYVALAVYTRFRRKTDDPETLNDVKIFYKNFRKAIAEKEFLSGEGILRFARNAYVVWSVFVQHRHLASVPSEDGKQQDTVDPAIKEGMAEYVRPSGVGVNQLLFDSSIVPKLRKFGFREKIDFDEDKSLVYIVEALTK